MENSFKYGSFKFFVDGVFLMTVRCSYGDVLNLVWSIHYANPTASIELVDDFD